MKNRSVLSARVFILFCIVFSGQTPAVDTLKTPFKTLTDGRINSIVASGNANRALITSGDGFVRLHDFTNGAVLKALTYKPAGYADVKFSPDGRNFAMGITLSYGAIGGGLSAIRLCRADNGDSLATFLDITSTYKVFDFSPDGSRMLIGLDDRRLLLLDSTLQTIASSVVDAVVKKISFSGNGMKVLLHTSDSAAVLLALPSLSVIKRYDKNLWGNCNYFQLSADGEKIAKGRGCEAMSTPLVLDASTGAVLASFPYDTVGNVMYGYADPIALSSDGQMVLLVGARALKVWDMESGSFIAILQKALNWSWDGFLGFSRDNSKIIVGNKDTIFVWDIATQALSVSASGSIIGPPYLDSARTEKITAVLMDGGYYGVRKDTAITLDLRNGNSVKTFFPRYFDECFKIAFSSDGASIFAVGRMRSRIWEVSTGQVISDLERVPLFPEQRVYLFSDSVNRCRIKDIAGNTIRTVTTDPQGTVPGGFSSISSDYRIVLSDIGNMLSTYDLSTGQKLCSIPDFMDELNAAALTPDGAYVLAGSGGSMTKTFNAFTGAMVSEKHTDANEVFVFSPAAGVVLSMDVNGIGNPYVWQLLDTSHVIMPYQYMVQGFSQTQSKAASFSPDGSKFLINNKLYQTEGGQLLKVLDQDEKDVSCVNFSPDGTKVVIGSVSNSIFVWDINADPSGTVTPPLFHSSGNASGTIRLLSTDKGRLRVSFPASARLTPFSKILIYRLSGPLAASVALAPDGMKRGICSIHQPQNIAAGVYLYNIVGIQGSFSGSKGTFVVRQ